MGGTLTYLLVVAGSRRLIFHRCVFLYLCVVLVYSVIIETSLAYHHTLDTCVVVVLMSAGCCINGSSLSAP